MVTLKMLFLSGVSEHNKHGITSIVNICQSLECCNKNSKQTWKICMYSSENKSFRRALCSPGHRHLAVIKPTMNSSVHEAICLTVWPKLCHTTGQWSQAHNKSATDVLKKKTISVEIGPVKVAELNLTNMPTFKVNSELWYWWHQKLN